MDYKIKKNNPYHKTINTKPSNMLTRRYSIVITFLIVLSYSSFSQTFTINGYVTDKTTGESIIGAYVILFNDDSPATTSTNSFGFFSIGIKTDHCRIEVKYPGYSDYEKDIYLLKDTTLEVSLEISNTIEEVIVSGEYDQVNTTQMSSIDIPVKSIQKIPVLMGETDLLKTIQLMPGVQSGTEGSSGFYVRGGGSDQNLILLDGVPVYNVNHLLGFFSVFNGYAIQDVNLIKGGFPARYGGRLSSVLDIRMKEGNMQRYTGEASSSIIASKFTFEGPIIKNKSSFIVSYRRTYLDLVAAPFIKLYSMTQNHSEKFTVGYFFQDFNFKINHKFSENDRLFFSMYSGSDKVYLNIKDDYQLSELENSTNTKFNMAWGNTTFALRYNHIFSPKLFGNISLTHSRYKFKNGFYEKNVYNLQDYYTQEIIQHTDESSIELLSGITDYTLKSDFELFQSKHQKIRFGISGTYHIFKPGITAIKNSSHYMSEEVIDTTYGNREIYTNELNLYAEDELKIGKFISINAGFHGSLFDVRDTLFYSLEPRMAVRFLMTPRWSIKASYSKMSQYMHFLANSTIGLPTDLWLPATDLIPPEKSVQYALGSFFTLNETFDFSLEGYYKNMNNLIEYKEGASYFEDIEDIEMPGEDWEKDVEIGSGNSYGVEFLARKNKGNLTGWIGYTLSWTNRQFESISNGLPFPYRYDRRHDIGFVCMYRINDHIDIGATWVYGTGIAVTLAQEHYMPFNKINHVINPERDFFWWGNSTVEYYGSRNNYRLPSYHRLDLGINFTKEKTYGFRTWNISVYNAYNRLNAFYVGFQEKHNNDGSVSERNLMKYSLFPVIPSIAYTYKFK